VTSRTGNDAAELVVAIGAPLSPFEPHSAVIIERSVAGGTRKIRRFDVRTVRERSSHPLCPLGLDAQVATQTDVLSHGRPYVDRRDDEVDPAHRNGLVYELE